MKIKMFVQKLLKSGNCKLKQHESVVIYYYGYNPEYNTYDLVPNKNRFGKLDYEIVHKTKLR